MNNKKIIKTTDDLLKAINESEEKSAYYIILKDLIFDGFSQRWNSKDNNDISQPWPNFSEIFPNMDNIEFKNCEFGLIRLTNGMHTNEELEKIKNIKFSDCSFQEIRITSSTFSIEIDNCFNKASEVDRSFSAQLYTSGNVFIKNTPMKSLSVTGKNISLENSYFDSLGFSGRIDTINLKKVNVVSSISQREIKKDKIVSISGDLKWVNILRVLLPNSCVSSINLS